MTEHPFTCPNCLSTLIINDYSSEYETDCNSCGAKVSIVPTFKPKSPEMTPGTRIAFTGILVVSALIGALGACMLMGRWSFWATFALIGSMIYLTSKLFLNRYHLTKIDDFSEREMSHVYIATAGDKFNDLVNLALKELPSKFKNRLKEINIVVEDLPDNSVVEKLKLGSNRSLAGLYQGIPLTQRSVWHGNRMPDKITIYKKNIENYCFTEVTLKKEIQRVVRHELGHFFGFNEYELREFEGRNK